MRQTPLASKRKSAALLGAVHGVAAPASLPSPTRGAAGLILAGMSDAARTLYLVCYDVSEPKRLRRVHRFLLGYKVGGQKSFFECWLTPAELRTVERTLGELIDPDEDRAHIFQLDPRMKRDLLGCAKPVVNEVFLIV